MGEAKRRGTFEQRKAQRLKSQYGLTNDQLDEAYQMNRRYDFMKLRSKHKPMFNILDLLTRSTLGEYKSWI